jgi:hypothetical protein
VAEEGPGKGPQVHPIIVFSHSPLYKLYRPWNFWTDDAEDVQAILQRFDHVTVLHGHTHQVLTNRIGNIQFHGMLSTAWPWPYAPQGLPALTVQMNRPNPFDPTTDSATAGHRASRRAGRQAVQLMESQSDAGQGQLFEQRRQERCARGIPPWRAIDRTGATMKNSLLAHGIDPRGVGIDGSRGRPFDSQSEPDHAGTKT